MFLLRLAERVYAYRSCCSNRGTCSFRQGTPLADLYVLQGPGSSLLAIAPIKKAALETGYSLDQMWLIGVLALICIVLYAIPTTSVLGAIILTGLLGSAITSHLRVAGTLTPEMIVSLILGVTAWGGLWFRDPQIRALIPRRSG